jgi:CBS domain containing-hemolysin-like protein
MMLGRTFPARPVARRYAGIALAAASLLLFPSEARASLLSPELEDKLANFLALFVIFIVPVVLIVLFWLVHIIPEKIAHQRHHPQFEAIRTLCLLSLVFGGLLWPIAWIWAYSKPVLYKMAYGSDAVVHGPSGHEPPITDDTSLQDRVARLEGRVPADELAALRADLAAIEAKYVEPEAR